MPNTGALKLKQLNGIYHFVIYTCAFPTEACQKFFSGKRPFCNDKLHNSTQQGKFLTKYIQRVFVFKVICHKNH